MVVLGDPFEIEVTHGPIGGFDLKADIRKDEVIAIEGEMLGIGHGPMRGRVRLSRFARLVQGPERQGLQLIVQNDATNVVAVGAELRMVITTRHVAVFLAFEV